MLDLEPPVTITIFDHGRLSLRRSNLPRRPPPLSVAEQSAWREAHQSSRPCEFEAQAIRAQAWPVHEPDWKREIIRASWVASDDAENCDPP
jgi:hypothetical protein